MASRPMLHIPITAIDSSKSSTATPDLSQETHRDNLTNFQQNLILTQHIGSEFRPGALSHNLWQQNASNFVTSPSMSVSASDRPEIPSIIQINEREIDSASYSSPSQIPVPSLPIHEAAETSPEILPRISDASHESGLYTSANKWERNDYKLRRNWERLEKLLRERFDKVVTPPSRGLNGERKTYYRNAALFPRGVVEWTEYSHLTMTWNAGLEKKKIAQREQLMKRSDPAIIPFLGGKQLKDCNLGPVLARPTAFCLNYSDLERDVFKSWPTLEQYRLEGDDRVKTSDESLQYGRFLPLPRYPSNNSVAWTQRNFVLPLKFDDAFDYKLGTTEDHHYTDGLLTRPPLPPIDFEHDFANGLCSINQFLNQDLIDELGTLN